MAGDKLIIDLQGMRTVALSKGQYVSDELHITPEELGNGHQCVTIPLSGIDRGGKIEFMGDPDRRAALSWVRAFRRGVVPGASNFATGRRR